MSRFPAVIVLVLTFAALAAAQEDWTPHYVLPPKQQQQQQPSQPQPAAAPAAPQQPPGKTIREFNEGDSSPAAPQPPAAQTPAPNMPQPEKDLRDIAERFAPVLHQRMAGTAEQHRFDYPTNFDFDGDWKGNNNWANAAGSKYKLWSYVYYSVIESEDHYFIHYAVYHPRDWSLVQATFDSLLDKLQDKYKDVIGGGARKEAEFNHENDLEGALVIVDKWAQGGPQPVAMETVAHNHLLRSLSTAAADLHITSGERGQRLRLEDGHPILYIESQKHGIHAWRDEEGSWQEPILVLRYGKDKPVEFSKVSGDTATYELIPISKTWWKHARATHKPNLTFGTVADFGDRFCDVPGARRPTCALGTVGAAIRGDYLRPNAASAPWNWIDLDDQELPLGAWFFDPIVILKRHFGLFHTREKYLYNPYLGIGDTDSDTKKATTP
ncbi:MAG TPA: hypothetical protein VGQ94_07965 [Terriglobales bacterium]|nr:hypothetical protein [Terriglobales bacterium]